MEAYVHGVSTRKVDDLVAALGGASEISKSEVSRICAGLDDEMAAFRDPAPRSCRVPLCVRGCHLSQGPRRRPGRIRAVVVATGVAMTGERRIAAAYRHFAADINALAGNG